MGGFNRNDRVGGRGDFSRRAGSGFTRGGGRGFGRSGDRGSGRGDRPMYKTTCSNCGKECEVPFKPTNGKPVYCSDCFEKMGGRRSDSPRPERSDYRAVAPTFDQNKAQLDALNVKLDKILRLLEPKVVTPVIPTEVAKDPEMDSGLKEIMAPKVKRVAKKSASTKKK